MRSLLLFLVLATYFVALAACSSTAYAQADLETTPTLVMVEETLIREDSVSFTFERGALTVPVHRARDSEETISVEVIRFQRNADAPADAPPIFVLRGGPGWPSIDGDLESDYFRFFLQPLLAASDLVFVGQRGFGTSKDTPCPDREPLSLEDSFDDALREQAMLEALVHCRELWESEGLDLTGFNVIEAAGDVADAARALGYRQIQPFGSSYGGHVGMAVLRYHPEIVARATIMGLEGPDHTYDSPDGLLTTLETIAAAAEASEVLAPHIPEGGLIAAYGDLIRRADAEPIVVETEHPDTGDLVTVRLDGDDFRTLSLGATRGLAWRYLVPAWPLDILAMVNGDYQAAARRIIILNTRTRLRNAAFYQLDCGSGITAERRERYLQSAGMAIVGDVGRFYDVECAAWDADLGDDFRTGFVTDIPTVLIHGTWDANTPYSNALELLPSFQNHHFMTLEGGSHGALWEAIESEEGLEESLIHWMATGNTDPLPKRVQIPLLPSVEWRAPSGE
ncbi:MAG: alpha/beta fold hydrolase [Bacteroidota bacterium]